MKRQFFLGAASALALTVGAVAQSYTPTNGIPDTNLSETSHTFGRGFWFGPAQGGAPTFFAWTASSPSRFVQAANGTAILTGTIQDVANANNTLDVEFRLSGFVPAGATPPAGSPKTGGLKKGALRENGGPIDPNGWSYYENFTGTFTGTGGLAGWRLGATRMGPAFQIGFGASLDNGNYGASAWFHVRIVSRGSNWNPGAEGDINTDLDFDRESCASLHEFTNGSSRSTAALPCADSDPVRFGRPIRTRAGDGYVVLRDEDWSVASTRARSLSEGAYVELCFTPKFGKQVSLTQVCFDLARNQGAVSRTIDVRVDEDPGAGGDNFRTVVRSLVLPVETGSQRAFRRYCIDLDTPALQGLTRQTKVRLYVWGTSPSSGSADTYLDSLCLGGLGDCIKASVTQLGAANCRPLLTMTVDKVPAFGTTPTFTFRSAHPNGVLYFFASVGCGDGSILAPGTTCKIWLNVNTFFLVEKKTLDATGGTAIPLPILPAYAPLIGVDFGFQGLLWTPVGDSLGNGIKLRLGCL